MRFRKAGKITDHLWYLGREESGTYYLEGQDGAILINGGLSYILPDVLAQMKKQGIRVELDESDDRFPKKIRNASKAKVPFVLIAGEEDRSNNSVSFRYRDGSQENGVPIDAAIAKVRAAIDEKRQVSTAS